MEDIIDYSIKKEKHYLNGLEHGISSERIRCPEDTMDKQNYTFVNSIITYEHGKIIK